MKKEGKGGKQRRKRGGEIKLKALGSSSNRFSQPDQTGQGVWGGKKKNGHATQGDVQPSAGRRGEGEKFAASVTHQMQRGPADGYEGEAITDPSSPNRLLREPKTGGGKKGGGADSSQTNREKEASRKNEKRDNLGGRGA